MFLKLEKNSLSTSLLVQQGYKVFFESNRVIITKHSDFMGKRYICDGLFKLSLMSFSFNKISGSSSLIITNVESCHM